MMLKTSWFLAGLVAVAIATACKTPKATGTPPKPSRTFVAAPTNTFNLASRPFREYEKALPLALTNAFNVAGSPFRDYDKALISKVKKRWYDMFYANPELRCHGGEVRVYFELLSNGNIQQVDITHSSNDLTSDNACLQAIFDCVPFEPLPEALLKLCGDQPREVNFTFYY